MTMQPAQIRGMIPEWTFADRLRKARLSSDLTQEEFADRLGTKPGAYSHWEAGRNTPRQVVTIAQRIEMLTGIPAAWMLGLDSGFGSNNPDGPGGSKKADEVSNPRNTD